MENIKLGGSFFCPKCQCTHSSECYALIDKPYWKARCKEPTLIDIIKSYLIKQWQDENGRKGE